MGTKDSTKTRVAPIFDELLARDPIGGWLGKLLALTSRFDGGRPHAPPGVGPLRRWAWGEAEIALDPPADLLRYLVQSLGKMSRPADLGTRSPTTRKRRAELLDGSPVALKEALEILSQRPLPTQCWCVFEGQTRPDVYLETDELVVVIEGKRTEAGPTTSTTWMPVRHQMLRHLDCAWEARGSKEVLGFFIVEGAADGNIPATWNTAENETVSETALDGSLPHRSPTERAELARRFLGVTTWQQLCREFDITWSSLPDTAD